MSNDAFPSSPRGNVSSGPSEEGEQEDDRPFLRGEVSLLDLLLVLARNKRLIVRMVLAFTLLGLTYSIVAPEQYTSTARVVRESKSDGGVSLPGGISPGALSGLGVNLGGATSGLSPVAFPDVIQGREVQLAVAQDTFQFPDAERPMSFVEYVNRPMGPLGTVLEYTVKLPWTLKRGLGKLISDPPTPGEAAESTMLTKEEDIALEALDEMLITSVDEETGLMSISVTAGGPYLASDLAQSFVDHLTTRVRDIRTKKVRERLEFVEERFQEAQKELEVVEDRLAQFLERNQNPTSAPLQFQRDRLQRQVRFKEQLYSDLQGQLTQTRLDLQRRQPVVTTVEKPVPPIQRSAPQRTLIVVLSFVLGGVVAVGLAFARSFLVVREKDPQDEKKMEEIWTRLVENGILGTLKNRGWGKSTS
jgi:tyrosine-protein kinase Etk/Wzc